MNSNDSKSKNSSISVPRDADDATKSRRDVMPSPDTVNIRDEDYPSENKPLVANSPEARALHENPPRGRDQLEAGSAGDAARPSKTGIMNPTLPPRS